MSFLSKFLSDDTGATAIEYGLIVALLAVGISAALSELKSNLSNTFTQITSQLISAQ